jgi:hypothetical protein
VDAECDVEEVGGFDALVPGAGAAALEDEVSPGEIGAGATGATDVPVEGSAGRTGSGVACGAGAASVEDGG